MKRRSYLITLILAVALLLGACGGGAERERLPQEDGAQPAQEVEAQASAGDPEAGKEEFSKTCAACHGPAGEGVENLGKDMTSSEFIAGLSDDELVDFVKVGRDPSDPLNTTGVGMPSKGGNPALSDEDLYDIVSYIRSLHN